MIPKVRIFVPQISKIKIFETKTEFEALLVEARCIRELGPKYNSRLTDDRSPLYIVITGEDFPRVLTARKTDLGGIEARSVYGPFLSGETVRRVLKIARRMFPYCNHNRSVSNQFKKARPFLKRPGLFGTFRYSHMCFYRHLGLCPGVCSGEISGRRYLSIIKKLELFLAGNFVDLKVKLEKEMRSAARKKDYERAAAARDAAGALGRLALVGEYEEETTVTGEERVEAVIKLLIKLKLVKLEVRSGNIDNEVRNVKSNFSLLNPVSHLQLHTSEASFRIECFDVSNLGGRLATAATAVFIGGTADPGEYRHFRIRTSSRAKRGDPDEIATPRPKVGARNDGGGDPGMIAEAVERRLSHPEWGKPDLVVIDGGKPQLLCIKRALLGVPASPAGGRQGESLIYLGLAKNPDRLVIPVENGFKTVRVSSRDLGFQLLQQVRDEAHRFSRRLHHKLRKRMIIG